MKLTIRARHLHLTQELHEQIRRRIYFAFDRSALAIRAVDVSLTDINGPKGGPDKQCRVRVRGRGLPGIVIEHVGVDPLATMSLAADRAARAVLRALARHRGFAPALAI
jgi:hypothetical protein